MRTVVAALGLFVLLSSPAAHAYRIDDDGNGHDLRWSRDDRPIAWHMVSGNAPEGTAGEDAVRRAAVSWSEIITHVGYRFDGFVSQGSNGPDLHNVVWWMYGDWPFDPTLVSATVRHYSSEDGRIVDSDVLFNGRDHRWSTVGEGYDIENASAHELGHVLGLGHSEDAGATMYEWMREGEIQKRTLEDDDRAAILALYDGEGHTGSSQTGIATQRPISRSGGGCSVAPHDRRAISLDPLLAVALILLVNRGRGRPGRGTWPPCRV